MEIPFYYILWLSIALIIIGVVKMLWDKRKNMDDKSKISLIVKIGIGLLLVGTVMPFLLVEVFRPEGVAGIELLIIAFYMFWLSIALIVIGLAKTLWDKRKNKNNIS